MIPHRHTHTFLACLALAMPVACAQTPGDEGAIPPGTTDAPAQHSMTAERLGEIIRRVDKNAKQTQNAWEFNVNEHAIALVFDESADRMRIMIPIRPAAGIEPDEMLRLLQANFDSALDARYAIARDILWATFIHPLSPLSDEEFLLGLGQTINIVTTYGKSYSSGMFTFGGGDSGEIQRRELLEWLKEQGTTT